MRISKPSLGARREQIQARWTVLADLGWSYLLWNWLRLLAFHAFSRKILKLCREPSRTVPGRPGWRIFFHYWKDNPSDERRAVGYLQPDINASSKLINFRRARVNPFAQTNMQFVLDVQEPSFFKNRFNWKLFGVTFLKNSQKQLNEESERFIWYELFTQINIRALMNVYRLNNDLESKVSLIAIYFHMPFCLCDSAYGF